jgi:hypothetical protein
MDLHFQAIDYTAWLRGRKPREVPYNFQTNPLYMGHTFKYETPTNFLGRFYVRPMLEPDLSRVPFSRVLGHRRLTAGRGT